MKIRVATQIQIGQWLFYVGEVLTEENLKSRDLTPEVYNNLIESGVFEPVTEIIEIIEDEPKKKPRRLPPTD